MSDPHVRVTHNRMDADGTGYCVGVDYGRVAVKLGNAATDEQFRLTRRPLLMLERTQVVDFIGSLFEAAWTAATDAVDLADDDAPALEERDKMNAALDALRGRLSAGVPVLSDDTRGMVSGPGPDIMQCPSCGCERFIVSGYDARNLECSACGRIVAEGTRGNDA